MNQWIKNRIKELTEQRKAELQKFYEDQWTSGDGEVEDERISIEYSENIIPGAIKKMEGMEGYEKDFLELLSWINFKFSIWHIAKIWDKIEEDYPQYIGEIKTSLNLLLPNTIKSWKKRSKSILIAGWQMIWNVIQKVSETKPCKNMKVYARRTR